MNNKPRQDLYEQTSAMPTRKLQFAGAGGAVGILVLAILQGVFDTTFSPEVCGAITLLSALGVGWWVRERR